jgi:hypothetical protein
MIASSKSDEKLVRAVVVSSSLEGSNETVTSELRSL